MDPETTRAELERGLALMKAKAPGYEMAEDYHEGTAEEKYVAKWMKKIFGEVSSFRITMSAVPVDKLVGRVRFNGFDIDTVESGKAIVSAFDQNLGKGLIRRLIHTAAKMGDAYALVWPGEEGEVAVDFCDPRAGILLYDEERPRVPRAFLKTWRDGKRFRVNVYLPNGTGERWITKQVEGKEFDVASRLDPEQYEPFIPDGEEYEDSTFTSDIEGFFPAVHFVHGDGQYGTPAHIKAYGSQDAITKIVVTEMSDFEKTGAPVRYGLRDNPNEDDGTEPEFFSGEEIVADVDPSRAPKLNGAPGAFTFFDNLKEIGQLDNPDPDAFGKPFERYIRAMATLTGTPIFEFDFGGEMPSGVALKRATRDIDNHAKTYVEQLGRPMEVLAARIGKAIGREASSVVANFAPITTIDDLEGWDVLAKKIEHGVPVSVVLLEAGYTTKQVEEWYPKGELQLTPASRSTVATTLRDLGSALVSGAITSGDIKTILPALFSGEAGVEAVDVALIDDTVDDIADE
jgi:hypothetical protein